MVFEPNFKKVVSSTRRSIGISQVVVDVKLPTQETNIENVFSVGARATVLSHEIVGNGINFNGLVDMQIVYAGDAGTACLDYSAEFKDVYNVGRELTGELILNAGIVDVSSQVNSNGVNIVVIVEISIDEIVSSDINVLVNVAGEKVYQSTKSLSLSTYIGKAYEKFDVSHDVTIAGAKSILMVTPCARIERVDPKENYLVLQGVLNLDICYKNGDKVEAISSDNHSVDFTWEVALNGINSDSIIESAISIIYNEIKVSTNIDDSGAVISVFVPMSYSGYVFAKEQLEVVDDVYIEDYYLSITAENFDSISQGKGIAFSDGISGVATIQESSPFIDNLIGVTCTNLVLARSVIEDDVLYVEGVATTNVLYYTKETSEMTSVQVEMPFVIEEKVSMDNASVVTICLSKVSARSKRGKEIEVSAELNVYADLYTDESVAVISDITLGAVKPCDDCSLHIYIVKPDQTLWDIAKEIGVSQDLILEQNSDVELPVKAGDRLVVYRPQIMKF